jgi:hypothetical protein
MPYVAKADKIGSPSAAVITFVSNNIAITPTKNTLSIICPNVVQKLFLLSKYDTKKEKYHQSSDNIYVNLRNAITSIFYHSLSLVTKIEYLS